MYDQPGIDSTQEINQNGEFMDDLNKPGTIMDGLVGGYVQMPLYDVGMTSLLVSEAEALVELAVILGRNETATMLRKRCADMRVLVQAHLWNEQLGIYANKFSGNSSFYPRISPTSFWPLFARAANESQAKRMMAEWLHSPTRFCVSKTGDMAGNNDMCYWGLPSISADDGAGVMTNHLGYWRGFVWGPLSILTYWSLQECVSFRSDSGSDSDSDLRIDERSVCARTICLWSHNDGMCALCTLVEWLAGAGTITCQRCSMGVG
jgi:hypothetical protein